MRRQKLRPILLLSPVCSKGFNSKHLHPLPSPDPPRHSAVPITSSILASGSFGLDFFPGAQGNLFPDCGNSFPPSWQTLGSLVTGCAWQSLTALFSVTKKKPKNWISSRKSLLWYVDCDLGWVRATLVAVACPALGCKLRIGILQTARSWLFFSPYLFGSVQGLR